VRYNFGLADGVLKGRGSLLRLRYVYTRRARQTKETYAVALQSNMRVKLARLEWDRRVQAKHSRAQHERLLLTGDLQARVQATDLWAEYTRACAEQRTHPIQVLQEQLETPALALRRYRISHAGALALACALRRVVSFGTLQSVALEHMDIRGDSAAVLAAALCSARCPLRALSFSGNPLSLEGAARGAARGNSCAAALDDLLWKVPTLTELALADAQLGPEGVARLGDSLQGHPRLTALDLSDNTLRAVPSDMFAAASAAGQVLAINERLLSLRYDWNNLAGRAGLAFLGGPGFPAQGLLLNGTLRRLSLRHTGVCRSAATTAALARCLASGAAALDSLDLAHCGVRGAEAVVLSEGVVANGTLRSLVLDGNQLGEAGYRALMRRVGRNRAVASEQALESRGGPRVLPMVELMRLFDEADQDGSGEMDGEEMTAFLRKLGFSEAPALTPLRPIPNRSLRTRSLRMQALPHPLPPITVSDAASSAPHPSCLTSSPRTRRRSTARRTARGSSPRSTATDPARSRPSLCPRPLGFPLPLRDGPVLRY